MFKPPLSPLSTDFAQFMLRQSKDDFEGYKAYLKHLSKQLPTNYPLDKTCPSFSYRILEPVDLTREIFSLASRISLCINKDTSQATRTSIQELLVAFDITPTPGFVTLVSLSGPQATVLLNIISGFIETLNLIFEEPRKLFTFCFIFDREEAVA